MNSIDLSCNVCNKNIGLLSFSCHCGNKFCNKHRVPEMHNCCFDYRGYAKSLIEKSNPKIKPSKLNQAN